MSDYIPSAKVEEAIRAAYNAPNIRPDFVDNLRQRLMNKANDINHAKHNIWRLTPVRAITFAIIAIVLAAILVNGPRKVLAEVQQLLGYIPGMGLVDQNSSLRILEEPVRLTRDGVTVAVNQALLTESETRLDYGVAGVPRAAYAESEAVTRCTQQPYFLLPDGTQLNIVSSIPTNVNTVVFILPCIFNTLPETVPIDWQIPLHFIPAPVDLTVLPVLDISATPVLTIPTTEAAETPTVESTSSEPITGEVTVQKFIETDTGYILMGTLRSLVPADNSLEVTGIPYISDANGAKVSYSIPTDIQPVEDSDTGRGGFGWVYQIKGAGISFPITFHFPGRIISIVEPGTVASFEWNVGDNPQPGQVWQVDRIFEFGTHTLQLLEISALGDGYSFKFGQGGDLVGAAVEIDGYEAVGGGGGDYFRDVSFSTLPKGKLNIKFTNPLAVTGNQVWDGQWAPEDSRTYDPVISSGACLDSASYSTLPTIPSGLSGMVFMTELQPEVQLVRVNLDGSQREVIAIGGNRGALSPLGNKLAYVSQNGTTLVDLEGGATEILENNSGYDLHWSPSASSIAYVSQGVYVVEADGKNLRQLSNLGYESIAGWSPDGEQVYYAIPDAGNQGFLLRSVNVNTGQTKDIFVLEDSSLKAPRPAISPDGKWIAYRASDNSSLYLKSMEGETVRLLLDKPGIAITGIVWEKQSHLLAVSIITDEDGSESVILLQWENCEAYLLPDVHGEVNGIWIP